MQERLFDAYFQRTEHVGRIPDLVDIAAELGLDRDEVTKSGIVLPDTAKEKPQQGEVLSVGPGDEALPLPDYLVAKR